MDIKYHLSEDCCGDRYYNTVLELIKSEPVVRVCEVGGGANPLLSPDIIREYGLDYTVLDISAEELAEAPSSYKKVLADISSHDFLCEAEYDIVPSKFLAEHVANGLLFHRNIKSILSSGGYAFHYFPTLYNLSFLINLILPEALLERILLFFQLTRVKEGSNGKFPVRYSWCYGPTKGSFERFQNWATQSNHTLDFWDILSMKNSTGCFL